MATTEEKVVVWKKSILRHLCNHQMRTNPKPFMDPTVDQTAHHEGCDYEYHKKGIVRVVSTNTKED